MAIETLPVPEEHLLEVIKVIRAGLKVTKVKRVVKTALNNWCRDEEYYLEELKE